MRLSSHGGIGVLGGGASRQRVLLAALAVSLVVALLAVAPPRPAGAQSGPTANADGTYTVPADWLLIPEGVRRGQTFRLLFLTTTWSTATSTSITTYDTFVQGEAGRTTGNRNQQGHPAIRPYASLFKVVGSTLSVAARDHTDTNPSTDGAGEPIYWLNGPRVAADYAGFWSGTWENWAEADRRNQQGGQAHTNWPYTGTNNDGTKHATGVLGSSVNSAITGRFAVAGSFTGGPLSHVLAQTGSTHQNSFYGISPVFKVASDLADQPDLVELNTSDLSIDEHQNCPSGVTSAGATLNSGSYTVRLTGDPGPGRYVNVDIYDPGDLGVGALADDIGRHAGYSVLPRPDTRGRVSVENTHVRHWRGWSGTPPVNVDLGHTRLYFDSSNWNTPRTVTVRVHCAKHHSLRQPVEIWHSARVHGGPVVYEDVYLEYPETEGITRPRTYCTPALKGCGLETPTAGEIVTVARRVIPQAQYRSVRAWVTDHDVPQTQATYAQELTGYAGSTSGRGGVLKTTLAWRWALPGETGNEYAHANENFDRFEVSMTTSGQAAQEAIIPAKYPWDKTEWSVALTVLGLPATNWGVVPTPVPYRAAVTPVTIRGDRAVGEVLQFCFEMADTRGYGVWFARSIACTGTIGTPVTARQQTAAAPTLSIAADTASVTEGGDVTFTVTADRAPATDLAVNVAVEEYMGERLDYIGRGLASSITLAAGQTTAPWTVTAYSDSEPRTDGRLEGRIGPGDGYTVGDPSAAAVALLDDDNYVRPEVSITAADGGAEGSSAGFTITADPPPVMGLVVDATVSATGDYGVATGPMSVLIGPSGSATLVVGTTDDNVEEPDGTVTATLNADAGYTLGSISSQTVNITDDDAGPALDAQLEADVRSYAAETQHGVLHVNRWKRVLVAFGLEDYAGLEPTTLDEARVHVDIGRPRWVPVLAHMVAMDTVSPQPVPARGSVQVDAQVLATARSKAAQTHGGAKHVNRWKRVLEAFGDGDYPGIEPLTAAAAQVYANVWSGWDQVAAQLRLIEAAATTDPTPVVVPPPVVVAPTPEVNIVSSAGGTEGATASFTLTASPVPAADLDVDVSVVTSGDFGYGPTPTSVTIPTSGTATVSITTADDSVDEPDGSVTLTVNAGSGYTVGAYGSDSVDVTDDDDPVAPVVVVPDPVVSITAGQGVTEGAGAGFTVTASPAPASGLPVTVTVAQSGAYAATGTRTVTIPTTGSVSFTVATTDDSVDELDGSVTVTVDAGSGYTVSATQGSGTVNVSDNDVPQISITEGQGVSEGGDATFTLTAVPAPATALDVAVTITQDGDYGAVTGSRTVTIPTGGSVSFTVATTDDATDEPDGSVTVTVEAGSGYTVSNTHGAGTVSVADNDVSLPASSVTVSVGDATGSEAGGVVEFTVSLSEASSEQVRVWFSTSNWRGLTGRAHMWLDYWTAQQTVVFAPGQTERTVSVWLVDDSRSEPDEYFTVTLTNPRGATIEDGAATGTITDDD